MIKNKPEDVWSKINIKSDGECWEWNKGLNNYGYGYIRINKKIYLVHRLIYELINSPIPKGMLVCHHCDNRKCCNPNHLFLGTCDDNVQDMIRKGRQCKGENKPMSKLIKKDVEEIRSLYFTGNYSQRELAKQFNVSQRNIFNIIHNIEWRKYEYNTKDWC